MNWPSSDAGSAPAIWLTARNTVDAEVARLREAGARFRNDVLAGPGGKQILLQDPAGNVVELFQPAAR